MYGRGPVFQEAVDAPERPVRPWVAAILSALVPGAGQWYTGKRRTARWHFGITLALLVALFIWTRDRTSVFASVFRTSTLIWLMVLNIAVFAFRLVSVDDAYRSAMRSPSRSRVPPRWALASLVFTLFLLLVPHVYAGYLDYVQYDLITSVFTAEESTTTTSETSPTVLAGGETTTTSPGETVPLTAAPGPKLWEGKERLNIALLGADSGSDRRGLRTDTMIVASIDPETGDTAMLSVPRNWVQVPLPDGYGIWDCDCFPILINELYQTGDVYPDAFPGAGDPKANAIKAGLGELLGIDIHYIVLVTFEGFVDVVDAIGGIEINVPFRIVDEEYPSERGGTEYIDIQPGPQKLDGHLALAYARARRHADDYARMGRQRCLLEAVVEQTDPLTALRVFPRLAEVIKDSVTTDIPLSRVPDIVELVPLVDTEKIVSIRFIPPTYLGSRTSDGYGIPNVSLIREHAEIATTLPADEAIARLGLQPLDDVCG